MTGGDFSQRIDQITGDFQTHFGTLPEAAVNWKPNPKAWSIGQVTEHLILINQSYYQVIEKAKKGELKLPWSARFSFWNRFLGGMILKSVKPDTSRKTKTFPIWEPSKSKISPDVLKQFPGHQEELKRVIRESSDLMTAGTVIHSPANKNITYPLETAFEIMVTHEQRHLNQALVVLNQWHQWEEKNQDPQGLRAPAPIPVVPGGALGNAGPSHDSGTMGFL